MKTNKISLTLIYVKRIEIEKGVYEDQEIELKIKAQEQKIFQSRKDFARSENNQLNGRFEIRDSYVEESLTYVVFKNKKYKINNTTIDTNKHTAIIEAGELA